MVQILIGIAVTLVASWVVLVLVLVLARPSNTTVADVARVFPDLLRLLRRLAVDTALPRGVRMRLWLLLAYLACPIDLVPDFLPVIGYADDVIITLFVLRSVVRHAGAAAIREHWTGSDAGLVMLLQFARIDTAGR